ncbi:MAG: APC family permease [Actinobacteria bacterium]|nr:APC family permease [Actinomycetota bacterium]
MSGIEAAPRPEDDGTGESALRRELGLPGAIAISVGLMAPTAAIALNGVLPATLVGRAVPLAFILATIGIAFVAYGFMRLTRRFSHAGSVYAFTGATLGPRTGFLSGWALFGCYLAFAVSIPVLFAIFSQAFLSELGIGEVDWLPLALLGLALSTVIAYGDVRAVMRLILGVEAISISVVLALVVVIYARLIGGDPPGHQTFTLQVFSLPDGVPSSVVGLAAVYGILSYAGFEAAGSMGEETNEPRRNIPRALGGALLVAAAFFIVVISAQSMGFGIDAAGVEAFGSSASPLAELAHTYVGGAMAEVINFGASISGSGSLMAVLAAGSRLLFAFDRDGLFGGRAVGRVSRTGEPVVALAVISGIASCVLVAMRLQGEAGIDAYFQAGTIGVLSLLVAYLLTTVGAWKYLVFDAPRRRIFDFAFPVVAMIVICYILYRQVYPAPEYPYSLYPYLVLGWLAVGLAFVTLTPGLSRRIGDRLSLELAEDGR